MSILSLIDWCLEDLGTGIFKFSFNDPLALEPPTPMLKKGLLNSPPVFPEDNDKLPSSISLVASATLENFCKKLSCGGCLLAIPPLMDAVPKFNLCELFPAALFEEDEKLNLEGLLLKLMLPPTGAVMADRAPLLKLINESSMSLPSLNESLLSHKFVGNWSIGSESAKNLAISGSTWSNTDLN